MVNMTLYQEDRVLETEPNPNPHPLTQVDFFHAKHRALKFANANAKARGLPPPKTALKYMDLSVVRNFEHYDDIGTIPNDPLVKERQRRDVLEAVEASRQDEIALMVNRERFSASAEQEKLRRIEELRAREEERRQEAIRQTWQNMQNARGPPSKVTPSEKPAAQKIFEERKRAARGEDGHVNKKRVITSAVEVDKENAAINDTTLVKPVPSKTDVNETRSIFRAALDNTSGALDGVQLSRSLLTRNPIRAPRGGKPARKLRCIVAAELDDD